MIELVSEYWLLLLLALLIGIAIAWYIFRSARKTRVTGTMHDPLDEGAERTKRNQALIDSQPAAVTAFDVSPQVPDTEPFSAAPMPVVPITPLDAAQTAAAPAVEDETASSDDLSRIKGIGPKLVVRLQELGVTSLAQIASWSDSDIERIDGQLGRFQGRIVRDDWVGQAKLLMTGNQSDYEAKFGKTS